MRMFRLLAIAATLCALSPCFAADLIIESRPAGQNHDNYKEKSGNWLDSNTPPETAKSHAKGATPGIGSRKVTLPLVGGIDEAVARFSPKFTAPGHYYVYATFPKAANATPVTYAIKSAKGETAKILAQDGWGANGDPNANKWISLGDFDFTAGDEDYVEFRVKSDAGPTDSRNPGQAYADSVLFSTTEVSGAAQSTGAAPAPSPYVPTGASQKPAVDITPDNGPIDWTEDLTAARAKAASEKKAILVYFYAPGSDRSSKYEKDVLSDPKVKGLIKAKFIPVKVNMDANRALASQLQVFRAGTVNVYSAAGEGLAQISDTPPPAGLISQLSGL